MFAPTEMKIRRTCSVLNDRLDSELPRSLWRSGGSELFHNSLHKSKAASTSVRRLPRVVAPVEVTRSPGQRELETTRHVHAQAPRLSRQEGEVDRQYRIPHPPPPEGTGPPLVYDTH